MIVQDSIPENYSEHPGLNPDLPPYEFYYNVLRKMIAVEYEDRNTYYPAIKRFMSLSTLFIIFTNIIVFAHLISETLD